MQGIQLREGDVVRYKGRLFVVLPEVPGDYCRWLGGRSEIGSIVPIIPDEEYEVESRREKRVGYSRRTDRR